MQKITCSVLSHCSTALMSNPTRAAWRRSPRAPFRCTKQVKSHRGDLSVSNRSSFGPPSLAESPWRRVRRLHLAAAAALHPIKTGSNLTRWRLYGHIRSKMASIKTRVYRHTALVQCLLIPPSPRPPTLPARVSYPLLPRPFLHCFVFLASAARPAFRNSCPCAFHGSPILFLRPKSTTCPKAPIIFSPTPTPPALLVPTPPLDNLHKIWNLHRIAHAKELAFQFFSM